MTYPAIIRAALALALVIGSPAGWCCCTGSGAPCSGSGDASRAVASHDGGAGSGCCASDDASNEQPDEDRERNPSCGCGAHDQQADLVRVAIVPGSQTEDLLPPVSKVMTADAAGQMGAIQGYAHGPPANDRWSCARTESLFALRSMLTV